MESCISACPDQGSIKSCIATLSQQVTRRLAFLCKGNKASEQ
jgi:hypothetical protein